jgi:type II secretory pathway pseudopilin PulG
MKRTATTLIELITAVAVLMILGGTVLISFNTIDHRRLEVESRALLSEINLARAYTVSRHDNYIIDFDLAADSYSIYRGSIDPNNLVNRHIFQVDLVSVTDYSGNPQTSLTFFFPRGNAQSRIVTLSRSGRSRVVNITDETGYARIE